MNQNLEFTLEPFYAKNAAKKDLNKVVEIFKELHLEDFPEYPFSEEETIKYLERLDKPYENIEYFVIRASNGDIMGYIKQMNYKQGSPKYQTNGHVAFTDLKIKQEYRRHGLGTEIVDILKIKSREKGCKVMEVFTGNKSAKRFAEKLGLDLMHEHIVNLLHLDQVDWELMQKWIDQAIEKAPDVTLEMFTKIPDEDLHQYTQLYTETINDAPWGSDTRENITPESQRIKEKDHEDRGIEMKVFCTREENGELSGITEIFYDRLIPEKIQQELTGVGKQYRGRGLGKWLKAVMAFHVKDNYPRARFISTGNAKNNEAILAINQEMGFKPVTVYHLYQIKC